MFHYRFMIIVFSCVTSRNWKRIIHVLFCGNWAVLIWTWGHESPCACDLVSQSRSGITPLLTSTPSILSTTQKPHITFVLPPFFFNLSLIFFTFILLFFKSGWTASSNSSFYPLALPNTINTILSYFKLLYLIYCIWSVRDTPKTHTCTHTCRHCGLH